MAMSYRITRRKQVVDTLIMSSGTYSRPDQALKDALNGCVTWKHEGDAEYEYFIEPVVD